MSNIKLFNISISEEILNKIKKQVNDYPWHLMPDGLDWTYGTSKTYLKELCDYWTTTFDWRKSEQELNKFNQFTTSIDEMDIHFIHEKGIGENPTPLLISHGWPGSISEFLKIIEPLTNPKKFGGISSESFDVIAPSLPGFGFSSAPKRPWGLRKMAGILNKLMTQSLGYNSYIAQGGDWGGAISSWLGYDYPEFCRAIHINTLTMRHPDPPETPAEIEWEKSFEIEQIMENGYRTQQATRPQSLGYAMIDSPVGIAAWIIEKFNSWSDVENNEIESVYTKNELLTNIMIYLVTGCFNSASWIYYGRREEGGRILSPEGDRVEVPTGCALFPAELLSWPPRTYVEKLYNVKQWTEMPRGGHFAAMEEPQLLIEDIRAFKRKLTV